MNLLSQLRCRFEAALQSFTDDSVEFVSMVRPAQDTRFGDYQANCAMPLAKQRGTDPRRLAAEIVAQLDVSDFCQEMEVAGPGFINLRLNDEWIEEQTNRLILDERLGHEQLSTPKKYVIDYSAPNVAKPMHVGHLRSTVIGDGLCRVLQFIGHDVTGDNHIGDWGTQFGMIIYGYKNFLDREEFDRDAVVELARLYRLVNQLSSYHDSVALLPRCRDELASKQEAFQATEAALDPNDKKGRKALRKPRAEIAELQKAVDRHQSQINAVDGDPVLRSMAQSHPKIADEARYEVAKLHTGDAENRQLWNRFVPKCLEMLDGIYERMGIKIDVALGESFYQPMLAGVVDNLLSTGMARESEGAICVFIEGKKAPFIVRKRDGAFNYATTDLATIKYRRDEFKADILLYVVDARQSEHFGMLFDVARLWGFDRIEYKHVSFGTILGDDNKPFQTRSGDTIGLESLLDESVSRARKIVDENDDRKLDGPELNETARAAVANAVGIGGLKYADLHHNRESDYVFNWEKMLATTGDTATYMQYAYARIFGIFRKGKVDPESLRKSHNRIRVTKPQERGLCLQLLRFPEAIDDVAVDYRPNLLTQYLFETADSFSAFHRDCPVLKAETDELRTSRLLLCDLTARVLHLGLSLLGIQTCEQM